MRTLITGGIVLTMEATSGVARRGDVLVDHGVIVEIAPTIDAPDAEVIDAADCIVMPGFVDTHRHAWQTAFRGIGADWTFPQWAAAMHGTLKPHYLPEDVYVGTLFGRLEALHSGVTTMLDWFHCATSPDHADAGIAALRDATGRSVFCYGAGWGTKNSVESEIRRVRAGMPDGGLVSMAMGLRGADDTSMDMVAHEVALADELDLPTSLHIAANGNQRPISDLADRGLLRPATTFVHVNEVTDDELRMLANAGCTVSISPDVELKMGFGWPMTGRMLAAGLRPTLSIDDVPSVGGDMFATTRTAFVVQRGLDGTLNSRDVLKFATADGAHALGLGDLIGRLTPGRIADIILLRTDDPTIFPVTDPEGTIVAAGHPGLVDTVLVAGRIVKRNGTLVGVDLSELKSRLMESRDRIAAAAGVRLDGSWNPQPTAI